MSLAPETATMSARTLAALALAVALIGAAVPLALAQPAAPLAQVVPAGSEVSFTTRQMGVPMEGRFSRFSARIALDPRKPATGQVSFTVDTASARFGVPDTDAEVGKPAWLSAAQFPQAVFQSTAIRAVGPGKFEVQGKLTLKGVSRELTVPVQLAQNGPQSTATAAFTLRRLDFRIGENEWADTSMVANDVNVRLRLQLTGLPPL